LSYNQLAVPKPVIEHATCILCGSLLRPVAHGDFVPVIDSVTLKPKINPYTDKPYVELKYTYSDVLVPKFEGRMCLVPGSG
jgi:hypothetical protein